MSLNFVIPEVTIGKDSNIQPNLKFNSKGFVLGYSPDLSWQDIVLSGVDSLTLNYSKNNGLNNIKLFGKCEQRSVLPDGYEILEYIQNTSRAWLNTGYKLTSQNVKFYIDFEPAYTGSSFSLYGSQTSNSGGYTGFWYGAIANLGLFSGTSGNILRLNLAQNNRYKLTTTLNNGICSYELTDDSTTTTNSGTYNNAMNTDAEIALFGILDGSTSDMKYNTTSLFKCRRFKIVDNGVIKRDLIPAKRSSDNAIGMYDLITDSFIENSGTSSFSAGSVITPPTVEYPLPIICNNGELKVDAQNQIYVDGDVETVKDSLNNTVTAQNLFAVGNYKDEQEILTGSVTRKCEVILYDGTQTVNTPYISTTGGLNIGSIIVHSKTNQTTETVTGQVLTAHSGTNVIEITQSSIDNLPLEVGYKGQNWQDLFTKLDYIESDGSQYIDTGIEVGLPSSMYGSTVDFQALTFYNNTTCLLFGAVNSEDTGAYLNLQSLTVNSSEFAGAAQGVSYSQPNAQLRTVGTCVSQEAGYYIPYNFLLFARMRGALGPQTMGTQRIYSARLYKDNVLVRNFVPVKDNNGVVGMFDTVTYTFYENSAGTGNFIAGTVAIL